MKIFINILCLILSLTLFSCKAKQTEVIKLPPYPIQLKKFPLEAIEKSSIRLSENTIFLWKKEDEMTESQVRDVQLLSQELDLLEKEQKELEATLNQLKLAYESEVAQLDPKQQEEWNALPEALSTAKETLDFNTNNFNLATEARATEVSKLNEITHQITLVNEELDAEKAKPDANQEKINELAQKLNELSATKVKIEKNIANYEKKQKRYKDLMESAQNDYNRLSTAKETTFSKVNAAHELVLNEEIRIAPEKKRMNDHGNDLVKKLTENVDILEKPSYLLIKVVQHQLKVEISWKIHNDCTECQEVFSTENGTIQNVNYQEDGGLLKFDLQANDGVYSFRLVRGINKNQQDRISFNGDIEISYTDQTKAKRFGALKFLDSKYSH